jgi:hypothetical protein
MGMRWVTWNVRGVCQLDSVTVYKYDGRVWIGFMRLRIWASGELLLSDYQFLKFNCFMEQSGLHLVSKALSHF